MMISKRLRIVAVKQRSRSFAMTTGISRTALDFGIHDPFLPL
jgi:hypothetical protein